MTNDDINDTSSHHDPLMIGELRPLTELGAEGPLSYESLRKYARSGKLHARRLGYQWFSTRAAIDAYLSSRHIENIPKSIAIVDSIPKMGHYKRINDRSRKVLVTPYGC